MRVKSRIEVSRGTVAFGNVTIRRAALAVFLGMLTTLTYFVLPTLLWTYNMTQAGGELERALTWPAPRTASSLPQVRDSDALDNALLYLTAAKRWSPQDDYIHRLVGQIYAARGEWREATVALETALELNPRNIMAKWEQTLAYEQLALTVKTAPKENILPDLASVPILAPDQHIDTIYCRTDQSATCYVDLDQYTQPYAHFPNGPDIRADVLFMHPPSGVKLTHMLSEERSALSFLIGLDPGVRGWRTDGATFQVWVRNPGETSTLVYEHTIDSRTARLGWVPGWADLSQWSGKEVTLELRTTGGPSGNTVEDWYGWGNVLLTTPAAAQGSVEIPSVRVREGLAALGYDSARIISLGDQALNQQSWTDAALWYERAAILEHSSSFHEVFRSMITSVMSNKDNSSQLVGRAQELDSTFRVFDVPVRGTVRVQGAEFRWMTPFADLATYGVPLSWGTANTTAGYMWWNGLAAAVIRVPKENKYELQISLLHHPSAPVKMAVGVDGKQVQSILLDKGDLTEEMVTVPLILSEGLHTIDLWYLNDAGTGAADRNAVLQWVDVKRKN